MLFIMINFFCHKISINLPYASHSSMCTRIFPFIKRCLSPIISTNVLHIGSGNERYAPLGFRINQKVKKNLSFEINRSYRCQSNF